MAERLYCPEQIINKLREAEILLNLEIFNTLIEAKILIGQWWKEYNQV